MNAFDPDVVGADFGARIDLATFTHMRDQYGRHASWALWAKPDEGKRTAVWVSDLSVFDVTAEPSRLDVLHRRIVFVALNSGVRVGQDRRDEPLAMFHDPVGRDFMLAEAIRGTPFWGAYLTDFFKDIPTRDGAGLRAFLKAHPGAVDRAAADLARELADLGAEQPLIVCLGVQVEPYVRTHFADYDIVRVSHYSRAMTKQDYRDQFALLAPAFNVRGTR